MKKTTFFPIILGTDANAYGMAKSFHQEYKIKPLLVGKKRLYQTRFTNIAKVKVFDEFDTQKNFMKTIVEIGKKYSQTYDNLLLISCGDGYTELIINNKEKLSDYFVIPYINKNLKDQLENKENFYKICEDYGLEYPKTMIIRKDNLSVDKFNFDYPVVLKASNSISFLHAKIKNKKKAYILNSKEELEENLKLIYGSSYKDNLILQEYIPGDDSQMWVLNSYSNKDGKVKMMCLGNAILEDYFPNDIGNYNAIITSYNKEIYYKIKSFLEKINYIGFSNFDMKYDFRDGKYKLFEINIRQGRSSYVVTGAGINMAKLLVDDYILNKDEPVVLNENEWLWLGVSKKVLFKYVNEEKLMKAKELIKKKKYGYTLLYNKDLNPIRNLIVWKLFDIQRNNYCIYHGEK